MTGSAQVDRPLRVLFFGTFDEKAHPRAAALRDSFLANGDDVRSINEPLRFGTAARVDAVSRPWKLATPAAQMVQNWWAMSRQARGLRDWKPDAVVVGYFGQVDVLLARLLFRCDIVLDMMVGMADTIESRGLRTGTLGNATYHLARLVDTAAQASASITVFDTDDHMQLLSRGNDDLVVPVGATQDWWDIGAHSAQLPTSKDMRRRVIFFGTYSALQGAPTIGQAIDLLRDRTDISFTMVGDGQERAECERLARNSPNVTWIDWIDLDDLMHEVSQHGVCLGIFGTTPRAQRVIPNKVYQGLAAGCHVITGATRGQVSQIAEAVEFVEPGDAVELASAITRYVDDPTVENASARLEWATPASLVAPLRRALIERCGSLDTPPSHTA